MKHVGNHGVSPKFCAGGRKVFALPNGYIGLYRDEQGSIIDVSGYGKVGKDIFVGHFLVDLLQVIIFLNIQIYSFDLIPHHFLWVLYVVDVHWSHI